MRTQQHQGLKLVQMTSSLNSDSPGAYWVSGGDHKTAAECTEHWFKARKGVPLSNPKPLTMVDWDKPAAWCVQKMNAGHMDFATLQIHVAGVFCLLSSPRFLQFAFYYFEQESDNG
jgi:hypothetical protein